MKIRLKFKGQGQGSKIKVQKSIPNAFGIKSQSEIIQLIQC